MVKLKHHEWDQLRQWFSPNPGYVLDFTNRTFAAFFEDHFDTNIDSAAFSDKGTSKFNRLRSFIEVAPAHVAVEILSLLWQRLHTERDSHIESAELSWRSDEYNPEYVAAIQDVAAAEDLPFRKMISDIASRGGDASSHSLLERASEWTLDTVSLNVERALKNVDGDPEAAITASCSMVESVCRSIILARQNSLPDKKDIQSLYRVVRSLLGLDPTMDVADARIATDVRDILSSLIGVVSGLGALRTHGGSAHGKERGFRRVDARIAKLSVNSACSVCLFLVDTWERKFPEDRLAVERPETPNES